MYYKLISLFPLQLARVAGLVRAIETIELEDRSQPGWVLLVRGRVEVLSPNLEEIRPTTL